MYNAYNEALTLAAERAVAFLEKLADRSTGISEAALAKLNEFDPHLPRSSTQAAEVVRQLDELGSDSVIPNMGGRFFGGVIGGAVPASVATRWLADVWDQNACAFEFSPIGAHLEALALRWVQELLALPATTFGVLVGGTQTADITCLAAARHDILSRSGWDVEADGLRGAPDIPVIVADEAHATIFKALSILGLGSQRVYRVPTDEQGRMIVDRVPLLDKPSIICVQAGNVNTGCFDNFRSIAEIA
jgi:glutamate/tyrosine decarboxylase-like PLP-dependent enzyme